MLATIDTWWLAVAGVAGCILALIGIVGGMWKIAHDNGRQTVIVEGLGTKMSELKESLGAIADRNDREHEAIRREAAQEHSNIWNNLSATRDLVHSNRERIVALEADHKRRTP